MWVYQLGYLDRLGYPVSTNYALDELAALVIGRFGLIHSGFGSAIRTRQREASGRPGKLGVAHPTAAAEQWVADGMAAPCARSVCQCRNLEATQAASAHRL